MARKRANAPKKEATINECPPLFQQEAYMFNALVEANNHYSKLKKQLAEYGYVKKQLEDKRKRIVADEIKMPVHITLIPNQVMYDVYEKKEVIAIIDSQLAEINRAYKAIKGQVEHRHDEYGEMALKVLAMLKRKYGKFAPKEAVGDRRTMDEDETLFEADFEKLAADPELQKEFKAAVDKAKKSNEGK